MEAKADVKSLLYNNHSTLDLYFMIELIFKYAANLLYKTFDFLMHAMEKVHWLLLRTKPQMYSVFSI